MGLGFAPSPQQSCSDDALTVSDLDEKMKKKKIMGALLGSEWSTICIFDQFDNKVD
jgi:hypothetical protein